MVHGKHASTEVKFYAVYCHLFLKLSARYVGQLFGKHHSTISAWTQKFLKDPDLLGEVRPRGRRQAKLQKHHHEWILDYVLNVDPLGFLSEIKEEFYDAFKLSISETTIWRVLFKANITKKKIEAYACQIRLVDVARYAVEVGSLSPLLHGQLLFLDETGIDRRNMQRTTGWGIRGKKLVVPGAFQRTKRISFLAFLGVKGFVEVVKTEGTFTRKVFFEAVQKLVVSGKVSSYPGPYSVWVMDGAKIHLCAGLCCFFPCWSSFCVFSFSISPPFFTILFTNKQIW